MYCEIKFTTLGTATRGEYPSVPGMYAWIYPCDGAHRYGWVVKVFGG